MFLLVLGLHSCQESNYVRMSGFTQGTTYSITYADKQGRDFSMEIDSIFQAVDHSMSIYNDSSVISRFNQSSQCFPVDSLLAKVVQLSLQVSNETGGAFDITVGPLLREWGFHIKRDETPTQERIYELQKFVGVHHIRLDDHLLCKSNPEVNIDVNAIAPGFTSDLIADFFESRQVFDYLVEVGGEIRTNGVNPKGEKWRVGVDKPVDNAMPGQNFQVIVSISGKALVTSGNYRKFYVRDGVKYSHTINPATGYPVDHSLLSATVVHSSAAQADALATAFMVMGVDLVKAWLKNNPDVETLLIFDTPHGKYDMWMSDGFKELVVER